MKKLYRVEVTIQILAVAESEEEAQRIFWDDETRSWTSDADAIMSSAEVAADVPENWNGAIPFGESDNHSCGWWLERGK